MTGQAAGGGLKRDLALITIGHFIFAMGQWAIGAALAKLAGVEAMAAFGLALAVATPIYLMANMALRAAVARDIEQEFSFTDYWRARLVSTVLAALAMGIAAFTVGAGRGLDGTAALLLFACVKSADAGFDLIYGLRQRDGQARRVALSLLGRATLGPVAAVAGLLAFDGALWAGLAAWAVAAALLFLVMEARGLARSLAAAPVRKGPWRAIARAWPLGVGAAFAGLETAAPRYAIEELMAPDALGYFTGVFLFFHATVLVAGALGSAATPHLGRAHAAGDKAGFLKLTGMLAVLGAGIGVCGVLGAWILGEWLLRLVYTADYAAYAPVLTLAMAAAGLRFIASFLQFALVAQGRYKTHMGAHIFLALIAAIASPPLVATYGLAGGAYALIVVGAAQLLLLTALTLRSARA